MVHTEVSRNYLPSNRMRRDANSTIVKLVCVPPKTNTSIFLLKTTQIFENVGFMNVILYLRIGFGILPI
jgi:hypothetical protein